MTGGGGLVHVMSGYVGRRSLPGQRLVVEPWGGEFAISDGGELCLQMWGRGLSTPSVRVTTDGVHIEVWAEGDVEDYSVLQDGKPLSPT
jgi:hypothetical protein